MALLRFINPTGIANYGVCDFRVFAAKISLEAADMREVYADYLRKNPTNRRHRRQQTPGHIAFMRITELVALLTEACITGTDVILEGRDALDYGWEFASTLMFEKRFVKVACPKCVRVFLPDDCRVLGWQLHNGYIDGAGRRVVCPAEHTLFVRDEWANLEFMPG